MSKCPHCGAVEVVSPKLMATAFACWTTVGRMGVSGMRSAKCYETEIARLKAKLDAPLKPLEWIECSPQLLTCEAETLSGSCHIYDKGQWDRPYGRDPKLKDVDRKANALLVWPPLRFVHPSLAAAQAHAEELHQAQGKETKERWWV